MTATSPLLELREVGFRYRGAPADTLSQVSFQVSPGRSLGIVGESGSGKTTILNLLLGLAYPASGTVLLDGAPLSPDRTQRRTLRRRVQPVFQDPYASLDPRQRVDRIIAEPLRSLGIERSVARQRAAVEQVLGEVGLEPDAARRYPHEFSGGQRQRIAIARALVSSPAVLVADEPVSALDMATRIEVIGLLDRLQRTRELTIVMVSHDLSVVAALCPELLVLDAGRIIETGPTLQTLANPAAPGTRQLIDAIPRLAG
jgi:peptide/nickel transport system ATP-binding protein